METGSAAWNPSLWLQLAEPALPDGEEKLRQEEEKDDDPTNR